MYEVVEALTRGAQMNANDLAKEVAEYAKFVANIHLKMSPIDDSVLEDRVRYAHELGTLRGLLLSLCEEMTEEGRARMHRHLTYLRGEGEAA